jgi:hypothetical protein
MPHIEFLASELLMHIFHSLENVQDVLSFSSTSKRLHNIYASSQQLAILESAAERQYGPLHDATQLLTQNDSQPAHVQRPINMSLALLAQIVHAGSVAEKWADIYPLRKWKEDFTNRRLLTTNERYRVRRAIYRLWLYGRAFHTPSHPRESRLHTLVMRARADLLRNWKTQELAEIADVRNVLRDVLSANICPSNGTVASKFRARYGDDQASHLVFNLNIHLTFPAPTSVTSPTSRGPRTLGHFAAPPPTSLFHHSPTYVQTTRTKALHLGRPGARSSFDPGAEGWGDSISHYYIVQDMLKLDPAQILWLKDQGLCRAQVLDWVRGLGDWFENYGDTWGETAELVLTERGEDICEVFGNGVVGGGDWGGSESGDE